jgi:hypothetical protein
MSDRLALMLLFAGALAAGYLVAATFFLRFWRQTNDRLFVFFALSFVLLAVQRVWLTWAVLHDTGTGISYLLRLTAFVLILIGILDKNRASE